MLSYFHLLKSKGFSYCFKQIKRRIFINDQQVISLICTLGLYDYLQKYRYVLDDPLRADRPVNPYPDKIWVCWLQGFESAPELVKTCVNTIQRHADGQDVVLLDLGNVFDYIQLPDYIMEKWKKGIISNAHFSDLIRITLLLEYGGVWIDATSYMTNKIPTYIRNADLFCFKTIYGKSVMANWFLVAKPYNEIIWKTKNLLYEYWKKENRLVGYTIFHVFFTITTESSLSSKKMWKEVSFFNDMDPKILQWELFSPYDPQKLEEICQFSFVQKLTYKFSKEEGERAGTFYDVLIRGNHPEK